VYTVKGELDVALQYYRTYLEISEEIGDQRGVGAASNGIGLICLRKGNLDEALRYYQNDLEICEKISKKRGIALECSNIGEIHFAKGAISEAQRCFRRSFSLYSKIGDQRGIGTGYFDMAKVHMERGNFSESEKLLGKAETIMRDIGEKVRLSEVYAVMSELKEIQKESADAIRNASSSLILAKEIGASQQELVALRVLGLALLEKDPERSLTYLKQSLSLSKKENRILEFGKSKLAMGKAMLYMKGKSAAARKTIREAAELFQRMGAHLWQEKAEQLLK
jgi:tetratricopeptide (TPR) repeat protein